MVFALLRETVQSAFADGQQLFSVPANAPPRLVSREEIKYCNKRCQDYVSGWEKNQKIYCERAHHHLSVLPFLLPGDMRGLPLGSFRILNFGDRRSGQREGLFCLGTPVLSVAHNPTLTRRFREGFLGRF